MENISIIEKNAFSSLSKGTVEIVNCAFGGTGSGNDKSNSGAGGAVDIIVKSVDSLDGCTFESNASGQNEITNTAFGGTGSNRGQNLSGANGGDVTISLTDITTIGLSAFKSSAVSTNNNNDILNTAFGGAGSAEDQNHGNGGNVTITINNVSDILGSDGCGAFESFAHGRNRVGNFAFGGAASAQSLNTGNGGSLNINVSNINCIGENSFSSLADSENDCYVVNSAFGGATAGNEAENSGAGGSVCLLLSDVQSLEDCAFKSSAKGRCRVTNSAFGGTGSNRGQNTSTANGGDVNIQINNVQTIGFSTFASSAQSTENNDDILNTAFGGAGSAEDKNHGNGGDVTITITNVPDICGSDGFGAFESSSIGKSRIINSSFGGAGTSINDNHGAGGAVSILISNTNNLGGQCFKSSTKANDRAMLTAWGGASGNNNFNVGGNVNIQLFNIGDIKEECFYSQTESNNQDSIQGTWGGTATNDSNPIDTTGSVNVSIENVDSVGARAFASTVQGLNRAVNGSWGGAASPTTNNTSCSDIVLSFIGVNNIEGSAFKSEAISTNTTNSQWGDACCATWGGCGAVDSTNSGNGANIKIQMEEVKSIGADAFGSYAESNSTNGAAGAILSSWGGAGSVGNTNQGSGGNFSAQLKNVDFIGPYSFCSKSESKKSSVNSSFGGTASASSSNSNENSGNSGEVSITIHHNSICEIGTSAFMSEAKSSSFVTVNAAFGGSGSSYDSINNGNAKKICLNISNSTVGETAFRSLCQSTMSWACNASWGGAGATNGNNGSGANVFINIKNSSSIGLEAFSSKSTGKYQVICASWGASGGFSSNTGTGGDVSFKLQNIRVIDRDAFKTESENTSGDAINVSFGGANTTGNPGDICLYFLYVDQINDNAFQSLSSGDVSVWRSLVEVLICHNTYMTQHDGVTPVTQAYLEDNVFANTGGSARDLWEITGGGDIPFDMLTCFHKKLHYFRPSQSDAWSDAYVEKTLEIRTPFGTTIYSDCNKSMVILANNTNESSDVNYLWTSTPSDITFKGSATGPGIVVRPTVDTTYCLIGQHKTFSDCVFSDCVDVFVNNKNINACVKYVHTCISDLSDNDALYNCLHSLFTS